MEPIVCPYCFEEFKRSEAMFRCQNDGCEKEKDEPVSQFWGQDREMHYAFDNELGSFAKTFDKMPKSATCPKCGATSHQLICPHCHGSLHSDMVEKKGFIISIIGGRGSGKTNYITVLIDQLMKDLPYIGGLGFMENPVSLDDEPQNRTDARYQHDFYSFLFKRKETPPQTPIGDPKSKIPLIYTINQRGVAPLHLVFYDTAGENFYDMRNIANNVQFLDKSDAVIFLLDTFAVPHIFERVKKNEDDEIELRYDKILSNITTHFQKDKSFLKKPIAFAFSKIDAILQNAEKFQDCAIPGMSLSQNSIFLDGDGYSQNEINMISRAIHDVLYKQWREANFVNNVGALYSNHRYFGFSALGQNPQADGSVGRLHPYRVLDPLIWILSELRYPIKKRNEKVEKYVED